MTSSVLPPASGATPTPTITITLTLGALKLLAPAALLVALLLSPPAALVQRPTSTLALRLLLGLWTAAQLNWALNKWATNNWRLLPSPAWDWPNELAVVTGGSGVLGSAIATGLAARGVSVAVLDLQPLPAPLAANPNIALFPCDVSSPAAIATAAAALSAHFGGRQPSIVVNNAGLVRTTTILAEPEAHLRAIVGVNLLAHWWMARQFVPHMVAQDRGHVVTVASLASYVALPTSVDYSATKAGALAFHEGLVCELKHLYKAPGVVATIVHPEFVDSPLTHHMLEDVKKAGGIVLTAKEATDPVLEQIFSGRGGHLVVPWSRTIVSTLRGWPNWMQELLRDVIGRADR